MLIITPYYIFLNFIVDTIKNEKTNSVITDIKAKLLVLGAIIEYIERTKPATVIGMPRKVPSNSLMLYRANLYEPLTTYNNTATIPISHRMPRSSKLNLK
ncbi:hypothetical protein D3C79_840990 [compost metagenome]